MKLYKYNSMLDKQWITLIPTIEVYINSIVYTKKSIEIRFSIFIWHFRLLFLDEKE